MERCSWTIPFIVVIVGDICLSWFHLVQTCIILLGLMQLIWFVVFRKLGMFLHHSILTLQSVLQGCCPWGLLWVCDPWWHTAGWVYSWPLGLSPAPGSAWLGSTAWMVSSSEVFFAFCIKAAQFLLLFMLQHLPSYTSGYWHEEASLKK